MPAAAAERALDTDGHGQIIGRGEGGGDPAPTEAYVGESEWPDQMPAGPIEAKPYQGMTAMQQLRTRGFAHFSNGFTPEFIEELRLFIDEGEQGVPRVLRGEQRLRRAAARRPRLQRGRRLRRQRQWLLPQARLRTHTDEHDPPQPQDGLRLRLQAGQFCQVRQSSAAFGGF